MNIVKLGMVSAIALGAAAPVYAQSAEAYAATDLNIRSGPGPRVTASRPKHPYPAQWRDGS